MSHSSHSCPPEPFGQHLRLVLLEIGSQKRTNNETYMTHTWTQLGFIWLDSKCGSPCPHSTYHCASSNCLRKTHKKSRSIASQWLKLERCGNGITGNICQVSTAWACLHTWRRHRAEPRAGTISTVTGQDTEITIIINITIFFFLIFIIFVIIINHHHQQNNNNNNNNTTSSSSSSNNNNNNNNNNNVVPAW